MNKDKSIEEYIQDFCQMLDVTEEELMSKSRVRHVADSRAILGYILITYFKLSLTNTGKLLNRHHSSVIHYRKIVPSLAESDPTFNIMLNKGVSIYNAYRDSGVRIQGLNDRFLISNKELRNRLSKMKDEMTMDRKTIIFLQEKIANLETEIKCIKYNYA